MTLLLAPVAGGTPQLDTIHHCDALTLLRALPDACVDMAITSPPYDNLRSYKGYSWDFEGIASQLYRVLKPGRTLVWVVGDAVVDGSESLTSFKQAIHFREAAGFRLHDTMIYQKDSLQFPDKLRYYQCFEYMFVFTKGTPRVVNLMTTQTTYFNNAASTKRKRDGTLERVKYAVGHETRILTNVWTFGVGYGKSSKDRLAFEHPATFPEKLAERHIMTWSNVDDVILDPFMGSGTTAIAARQLNRRYIGCDISAEYVALAKRRLAQPFTLDMFYHAATA